jgi:plasmid stabilization system protein ParE
MAQTLIWSREALCDIASIADYISRDMSHSTYLTHRLNGLKFFRWLAAQPAQRHYCSSFGRQSQYTRFIV